MKSIEEQYVKDSGDKNAKMHDGNMLEAMKLKSIEQQIEALTQELRPYPEGQKFYSFDPFDPDSNYIAIHDTDPKWNKYNTASWKDAMFASTNKADVEEYADCYKRLKLYQLLGLKAEKEFPVEWVNDPNTKYATDFFQDSGYGTGMVMLHESGDYRQCVLGGVWFANESDRLEALKICGIDRHFQELCAKYSIGGA